MTPARGAAEFQEGLRLHQAGDIAAAEGIYAGILDVDPNHVHSLHLLGVLRLQQGQVEAALDLIGRALALAPDLAEAHNNLGLALQTAGCLDDAVVHYRTALALQPGYPDAMHNLGHGLLQSGQADAAISTFRQAVALAPQSMRTHVNLGLALQALGQLGAAADSFRQALALDPNAAEAPVLQQAVRLSDAIAHYERGNELRDQDRLVEAIGCYEQSILLSPDLVEPYVNLGVLLNRQGDLDGSIDCYRQGLGRNPDAALLHYNLGLALLSAGRLGEGFAEYAWRWQAKGFRGSRPAFAQPVWQGEALPDRIILLHTEQGWGDAIQFIRYADLVKARCRKLIVYCPAPLRPLFESIDSIDQIVIAGDPAPGVDCHAALLDLPTLLNTTTDTIPAAVPYLRARPNRLVAWRARLADAPGLRIGLVWRGRPTPDPARSIAARVIAPLCKIAGTCWYSLQLDADAAELALLSVDVVDCAPTLGDWADTGAAVAALDLVISVDTAVAHLAGALAKPVWVLLPFIADWRWQRERRDSPWYPTMRLFRQAAPGAWAPVVDEVAAELGDLVGRWGHAPGRR